DATASVADVHELIVPIDQSEPLEEYSIGHAKHRGVDSDAQCKHRYGNYCEAGVVDQGSNAQADVAEKIHREIPVAAINRSPAIAAPGRQAVRVRAKLLNIRF